MRIDNCLRESRVDPKQGMQPHGAAGRLGSARQPTQDNSTHTPAPELLNWVAQIHKMSDVREEVVSEVKRRLTNGDYSSTTFAERAAEGMLNG